MAPKEQYTSQQETSLAVALGLLVFNNDIKDTVSKLLSAMDLPVCFVEIVTTSQSINELNYFPNCDTLQARQPFGNYSVLLYLYFTVITFLIRLLCVTYRFRTTLTKNKQQFETHGFGCVSQQNTVNPSVLRELEMIDSKRIRESDFKTDPCTKNRRKKLKRDKCKKQDAFQHQ